MLLLYQIKGESMAPTLKNDQKVLAIKFFFNLHKNDVIILKHPTTKQLLIKRITKMKNNSYYVEGDNKHSSTDSRDFDWIKKDSIVAKVVLW